MNKKYEIDKKTIEGLKFIIKTHDGLTIPFRNGTIKYLDNLKEIKK